MKRFLKKTLLLVVAFCLLGFLFYKWLTYDPASPRFQAGPVQLSPGTYQNISYEFLSPSPFEGGKMWISIWNNGTRGQTSRPYHTYLYDIEKRAILGELINAQPGFFNRDQSKMLCVQRSRSPMDRTWLKIVTLIKPLSAGKINFAPTGDDVETFWELDLRKNSASRLGKANQVQGAGSSFFPSPGFRYGYNKATASFQQADLIICDLENGEFRKDAVDGWPIGWWDDHQILVKDKNNDFVLYDVVSKQTSPFLSLSQCTDFYTANGLTNNAVNATPFIMWNGRENDFYMTDGNTGWSAVESFLAKIARPAASLTMLNPHFKFEWSDHFNAAGDKYLYTGRDSGKTNSAAYLRDLQTGQTREVVPPDPNNLGRFSIPFFYHDEIIYVRSNMLWEINEDGSDNRQLFPP